MILGIGSDLIDIRRVEQALARHGARFKNRLFTPLEQARSEGKPSPAASYAKRFAAKEACAKALGTGMHGGVYWRDMGVTNHPSGRPSMVLAGGAAARLAALTPLGFRAQVHVSLTDDFPLAQAFVIISAERDDGSSSLRAGPAQTAGLS